MVGGKIPVDASVSIDPAGLATEATTGDIKTAVEALAVATPDTADGDLADINAAAASIDGKLPALVGGKIPVDASVSIDPAGLATEATAGDIKTAVEALAGATPDTASGDLASMSADLGTIQTDLSTVKADIALMKADLAAILAILES